jgi:hypothetical protein
MSESKNEIDEEGGQDPAIAALKDFVNTKIKGFKENFYGKLENLGADSILIYLISINLYKIIENYSKKDNKLIELIWPYEKSTVLNYLKEDVDKEFLSNLASGNIDSSIKKLSFIVEKMLEKEKSRPRMFEPLFEKLLIVTETMEIMRKNFEDKEFVLKILVAELKQFHSIGMFSRTVINIPSEQLSKSVISRGDLKIQIDTGKPILVAGEEFSIFVKITNPYEVPLVLFSVDTQIPVDLKDVLAKYRKKYLGKIVDEEDEGTSFSVRNPLRSQETPEEDRIAHGISTTDLNYIYTQTIPPPILLQPDDSIVKQFILKTNHKWLFTPIALTLEIQVKYGVDHREHLDTAKVDLAIQSPLSSIAMGAIIGSIAGSLVRILYQSKYAEINESSNHLLPLSSSPSLNLKINFTSSLLYIYNLSYNFIIHCYNLLIIPANFVLDHFTYILLSVILSSMVVVAFARKSGVQKIISIEDFFGGLFLGFLVGFSGPEYALNLIMSQPGTETSRLSENLTSILQNLSQSVQNLNHTLKP